MKIYEKKDVLLNGGIAIKLLAGLSRFIVMSSLFFLVPEMQLLQMADVFDSIDIV